ncbi:MAG: D-alanine--D-alanine ligase [Rickettsiaceae bacterium]
MNNFKTIYKEKSLVVEVYSISQLFEITLADFVKLKGQSIDQFSVNQHIEKKHVVVIGGGMSAEREVSYMSSNGIVRSIIELGHHVTFVDMGVDIALVLTKLKPDVVYNALHGTYGEDGCLPGLLNIMHIPYTGPGVLASAIAFNKKKSCEIFKATGIKIPESKVIKRTDHYVVDPIKRPYVIKPLSQGSSVGVEIIFDEDDFSFAEYDFPYGDEVLVEQYIKGREMQIAVLNGRAIGVLEIKLLKDKRFYDYETKYTEGFADHLLPAPVPLEVYDNIKRLAEKACNIFDCMGMVRVEVMYSSEDDEIYMLEVNTHTGMTPLSICPEIATLENMTYKDLVKEILEEARFE